MRIGYRPENRISRFLPRGSTTRWIVGASFEVAQFSGTWEAVGPREAAVGAPLQDDRPPPCPLG